MTDVEVWRIEFPDGAGPYRFSTDREGYHLGEIMSYHHSDDSLWATHPMPREDRIWFSRSHLFGCLTLESLRAWFIDFWADLEDNGLTIQHYLVPADDVRQGTSGYQVAFHPANAVRETVPW